MSSPKKCICLLMLFSLFALFLNAEQRTIKILGIGNSYTVDAFEDYLAPLAAADDINLVIGYPYKGGTNIDEHWAYVENNEAAYTYRKIVNGTLSKTSGKTLLHAIQDEAWDYVIFQTNYNDGGDYELYLPYLTNVLNYVKTNISNPNVVYGLFMGWAYDTTSTHQVFVSTYNSNQEAMYQACIGVTDSLAKYTDIDLVIPVGTAIQNGRTSCIGGQFNRDGFHLNYDWGRYTASCVCYEKITGNSVLGNTYRPKTLSEHRAEVCQRAAHEAILNPTEVTPILDAIPHNNDIDPDLPVYINFTNQAGGTEEEYWNDLQASTINSMIANLANSSGGESGISLKVSCAFNGIITTGSAETDTRLDMPSNVSSTAFWGNGLEEHKGEITISGLNHERLYDFTVFASLSGANADYETTYTFTGTNRKTGSLNPYNNTEGTAVIEGVQPGRDGRIVLNVADGQNNTDASKRFYLGAMMITPQDDTAAVPYNSPWNGYTLEEPERTDGVYQITSGSELAWYAAKVNGVLDGARQTKISCILQEDIDLGGHEWTPIADARYLPSNSTYYPYYAGTFDGNFKKITGLMLNADMEYSGFFGSGNECDVKNLSLSGELIITATKKDSDDKKGIGVLVAYASVRGTYTNCAIDVNVTMNTTATFTDLPRTGILMGRFNNGTLSNVSYTGTYTAPYGQMINLVAGTLSIANGIYSNVHYLDASSLNKTQGTAHTAEEYHGGEVAYLLQEGQSTQIWGQILDGQTATYPILSSDAACKVYETEAYAGNPTPEKRYFNSGNVFSEGGNVIVFADEDLVGGTVADNVVVKIGENYTAENIVLSDGYDFYVPSDRPFTASKVSYTRECFIDGTPETIILPFVPTSVTSDESSAELSIAAYDSISYTTNSVNFVPQSAWTANTPYLLYVDGASGNEGKKTYRFEADNVTPSVSVSEGVFNGTYQTVEMTTGNYLLDTDSKSFVQATESCPAFRAYFNLNPDPEHSLSITYNKGEIPPSGINEIGADEIRDFDVYGIDGRRIKTVYQTTREEILKTLPRGVYIINGEKVFKTM